MRFFSTYFFIALSIGIVSFNSCQKELSCEGCRETNQPPIALAGPDQVITLPTDSISLDGSASSDPDGTISEWLWTRISGPASFSITSAATAQTPIKNLVAGTYQFELKVTDDKGSTAKDTIHISVDDTVINQPPVANAGPDQTITLPVNTINLDGSGSTDPDNNMTSYSWKKISGPSSFYFTNASFVRTQATDLVEGVYQFELNVTDANGLFSQDTVIIFVNTNSAALSVSWEAIIRFPINSIFIDDYYRDAEGTCVGRISGPDAGIIEGGWVKDLKPGVYYFRRYWSGWSRPAEVIKVTVLDDPNERNTITYKNLLWEISEIWDNGSSTRSHHLFLPRPAWPGDQNPSLEVYLQMNFFNNGEWFKVPSVKDRYEFYLDCRGWDNTCLSFFVVKVFPENKSWAGENTNLKIKIL